jgi:hypothetical protein
MAESTPYKRHLPLPQSPNSNWKASREHFIKQEEDFPAQSKVQELSWCLKDPHPRLLSVMMGSKSLLSKQKNQLANMNPEGLTSTNHQRLWNSFFRANWRQTLREQQLLQAKWQAGAPESQTWAISFGNGTYVGRKHQNNEHGAFWILRSAEEGAFDWRVRIR